MNFENGRHLSNYILKIFKNNDISLTFDDIGKIKDLANIYSFIEKHNLNQILYIPNDFDNWIELAKNDKVKALISISEDGNYYIKMFETGADICFSQVFTSFRLNIKYRADYLLERPASDDKYYPKKVCIFTAKRENITKSIYYYTKPQNIDDKIFGCYMIYDLNNELAYIGKSNSNLLWRSSQSARDRLGGNFSKIELYPMTTHADTNIYELYFIAKYKPFINMDSNCEDYPSFELPSVSEKIKITRVGEEIVNLTSITFNEKVIPSSEYWENKNKYLMTCCPQRDIDNFLLKETGREDGIMNYEEYHNRLIELNKDYLTFPVNTSRNKERIF